MMKQQISETVVRLIMSSVSFLMIIILAALSGSIDPLSAIYAFSMAALLVSQDALKMERLRLGKTAAGFVMLLVALSVYSLCTILHPEGCWRAVAFLTTTSLMTCVGLLSNAWTMLSGRRMSGDGGREWELMRSYASSVFIAMVYVLFSMAYMTVVACADKWSVGSSLAVLLTGFVAALCCIRRLVADSSVNGNGLKSRMKRRMRDFALSGNAAVPAINYRILYGRAKEYMEERRPYLNPSFSLTDLAKAMCCNSGYVSKSINSCTGKNYSQFVNGYRVEYAMEMFRKDNSLMVSELMQVSGFSNKVTFNLAFKSVTGLTPGEWCRQCLESVQKEKGLSNLKAQRK